jgi:hypothetical protein
MNKLNKILVLAMFSVASLATNVFADSSNFEGPYLAVQASVAGVEIDGSHEDTTMTSETKTTGRAGMIGTFGSVQLGYNIAAGAEGFITIGGTHTPTGDASFAAKGVAASKKVDLVLSDINEVFIEPSVMVTSNSAVFVHVGYSEAELSAKGDDITDKTLDMDGMTVAAGLKVVTDAGVFIKVEAGMTEYDTIKLDGITDADDGTTATAQGDPTVAFGTVSLGVKF